MCAGLLGAARHRDSFMLEREESMANHYLKSFKQRIIGRSLPSSLAEQERYSVLWGLPALSSDAISSVAYACEEILLVLVPVIGLASFKPMLGIVLAIIGLLALLVLCYRQVIEAYPQGGGAYFVAKANLGTRASLICGGALVIDYVLTVAVSASSGTAAVASAFPQVDAYRVPITILFILLLTLGNLRGTKESSRIFGLPTYFFILSILTMIVVGVCKVAIYGCEPHATYQPAVQHTGYLSLFLILHAFSSGCSALTGVEAVSNSVPNFQEPQKRNANITLVLLALLVFTIFGGVSVLASLYQVTPHDQMTVVSQISAAVFGVNSLGFYGIQLATMLILLFAANTAYNGLPQLMSILARDEYLPHRFADKGTRLVYSSGILFTTLCATVLVVVFQAQTHHLIPLYSVGVFISFTLAQAGMVRHWQHTEDRHRRYRMAVNAVGACVTGVVCLVIIVNKFSTGAWAVLVLIALIVLGMHQVKSHYTKVRKSLAITSDEAKKRLRVQPRRHKVVLPLQRMTRAFIKTLNYAIDLSDDIELYHVSVDHEETKRLKRTLKRLNLPYPLVVEQTEYRNVSEVLINHIDELIEQAHGEYVTTIIVAQYVPEHAWQLTLHNQTTFLLTTELLHRRDVLLITVPYQESRIQAHPLPAGD